MTSAVLYRKARASSGAAPEERAGPSLSPVEDTAVTAAPGGGYTCFQGRSSPGEGS